MRAVSAGRFQFRLRAPTKKRSRERMAPARNTFRIGFLFRPLFGKKFQNSLTPDSAPLANGLPKRKDPERLNEGDDVK